MLRLAGTLTRLTIAMAVLLFTPAALGAERSGIGPCRQGVLALISMIDAGEQRTPSYRHAFTGVVQTCGAPSPNRPGAGAAATKPPAEAARKAVCARLALAMLDTIEAGRLNSRDFAKTRGEFARTCGPF